MERLVPLEKAGRDFDVEFWQRQGDTAIFAAAWDLVVTAQAARGVPADQLPMKRTVERLLPVPWRRRPAELPPNP